MFCCCAFMADREKGIKKFFNASLILMKYPNFLVL